MQDAELFHTQDPQSVRGQQCSVARQKFLAKVVVTQNWNKKELCMEDLEEKDTGQRRSKKLWTFKELKN